MCEKCLFYPGFTLNPRIRPETQDQGVVEKIIFVTDRPIIVEETSIGDIRYVKHSYQVPAPAQVNISVIPTKAEVGQVITGQFSVDITPGTENIISKEVSPGDVEIPDLVPNSFDFSVEGITRNTAGVAGTQTVTVTDEANSVVSDSAGIVFEDRFFMVLSTKKELVAADINVADGILGPDIKDGNVFGGKRIYVIPAPVDGKKHYIHFLFPTTRTGTGNPKAQIGEVIMERQSDVIKLTNPQGLEIDYYAEHTKGTGYGESTFELTI